MGGVPNSVKLDKILSDLYEGVEHDEAMTRALDRIGDAAGMLISSCERMDLATGQFTTIIHSGNASAHPGLALLENRARELNPYYKPEVIMRIMGQAQFANDVLSRSIVKRTAYYADYLAPLGIQDIAGYFFQPEPGIVNILSFPRDGKGSFRPHERDLFQTLTPHILQAFGLRHRLNAASVAQKLLERVLDEETHAVLLIDENGHVFWRNSTAERLLTRSDGLCLLKNTLSVQDSAENARFQCLLKKQLSACCLDRRLQYVENYYIPLTTGFTPYAISLHPLSDRLDSSGQVRAAVCAIVVDPLHQHSVTCQQLITQYGLTKAEADVTLKVGSGWSLDAIADDLGQKVSTTRNLLKRAMRKTDTHRQTELAARIWSASLPNKSTHNNDHD